MEAATKGHVPEPGHPGKGWKGVSWKWPEWIEPVLIVMILLVTMWCTRRRNYSILNRRSGNSSSSSAAPLLHNRSPSVSSAGSTRRRGHQHHHPAKRRSCLGLFTLRTPNSSRFASHPHSRILQKFPFLIEMFYWAVTFFFYRLTGYGAQWLAGGNDQLWDTAQDHAIGILELETALFGDHRSTGTERWAEWRIQQWFLVGAEAGDWRGTLLSVLNRWYAVVHIPGTVAFVAYYYATAKTHARFTTARRTMSLLNLLAFSIFLVYPVMPPRFLPHEFGFVDTVNAEDAESVWMSGKYVNKLAAMPSLHFAYTFCIGVTFIYESELLQDGFRALFAGRRWPEWMPFVRRGEGGALMAIARRKRRAAAAAALGLDDDLEGALVAQVEHSGGPRSGTPVDGREWPSGSIGNDDGDESGSDDYRVGRVRGVGTEGYESEEDESAAPTHSPFTRWAIFIFGLWYPPWTLLAIVATANHYFLDAFAGAVVVFLAFLCNRVLIQLLPLEDCLLWVLRLEKPEPTTGVMARRKRRDSLR